MQRTPHRLAVCLGQVLLAGLAASLVACGGGGDGAQFPLQIPAKTAPAANTAPVANAGSAQSVFVGAAVTLDGSRSTDADGDALTYAWRIVSKPNGSSAAPARPGDVKPGFIADLAGDYVFQLVVNDGKADSQPATVTVSAAANNLAPVAQAGPLQNVFTGSLVSLDGSASSDPNGDALGYAWTLTPPAGSVASLINAATATPQFTPDVAGSYVATLVVSDGQLSSVAATVTITAAVANVAPVAEAGPAQSVLPSTTATLDGSGSSDANGDTLTYSWSLVSMPSGGSATLASPGSVHPSFTPGLNGVYVLQLIVNDGQVDSAPDTVVITASAPPTANAGPDILGAPTGIPSILDGSASAPAPGNSTPLTYLWSVVSDTSGSVPLGAMTDPSIGVFVSHPGTSVWQLKVCQDSLCSTDTVTVTSP